MQLQIDAWVYTVNSGVIKSSKHERILEPLIEKLFLYFINNHDRIISRQELMDNVWQLSFVDDNSINRAISELRKQLKNPASNHVYIKTHYRRGYSLTITPLPIPQVPANELPEKDSTITPNQSTDKSTNAVLEDNNVDTNNKKRRKLRGANWSVFLILLFMLCIWWLYPTFSSNTTNNKASNTDDVFLSQIKDINHTSIPASWLIGSEFSPRVSPNAALFSFVNESESQTVSHVSSLYNEMSVPVKHQDYDSFATSWQPGTSKLLVRLSKASPYRCFWAIFETNKFPAISFVGQVMPCAEGKSGFAQMNVDGTGIYYAKNTHGIFSIEYWDIEHQRSKVIIPSYDQYLGVRQFNLSPDGTKIVYQREQQTKPTKVYIYDINSMEHKKVFEFPLTNYIRNVKWNNSNHELIWSNPNGIQTLDIDTNSTVSFNFKKEYELKDLYPINSTQALTVEYGKAKSQINVFDMSFNMVDERRLLSDGLNFYPRFTSHGLTFISNRNGTLQYWLDDGTVKQLSSIDEGPNHALYPIFASHNQAIYILKTNEQVFLYNANEKTKQEITFPADHFINIAALGPNNEYLFTTVTVDSKVQVWKQHLASGKHTLIKTKTPSQLLNDPQGNVYYTTDTELIGLTNDTYIDTGINLSVFQNLMSITNKYFYVFYKSTRQFAKIELSTGKLDIIESPYLFSGFSVNADDSQLAATTKMSAELNINLTQWSTEPD